MEKLNYECRLFKEDTLILSFDFKGDSKELAADHAAHCMNAEKANVCHYRKKGNQYWKVIKNDNSYYSH